MRDVWKGTQLRDAWVKDRSTFLASLGMAIALTQPFFTQNPDKPAEAHPCVQNVPRDAGVSPGVAVFGGT
eukprot:15684124-Heterocapsa_arctica.AAC.1